MLYGCPLNAKWMSFNAKWMPLSKKRKMFFDRCFLLRDVYEGMLINLLLDQLHTFVTENY